MIIPARWYAGGKGLDEFRDTMLTDPHIQELHDFPQTEDCFPGVNIRGGVCYFLWSREHNNKNELPIVFTHNKSEFTQMSRPLKYKDLNIFIRYGDALEILNKVMNACGNNTVSKIVSPRKPFGLPTDFTKSPDFHQTKNGLKNPVSCYAKGKMLGYVERGKIPLHTEWIDRWKVMTSRANNIGTELNDDNLNAFVISPSTICTESYIVIGADSNLTEASCNNLALYLQTKFARFLHSLAKSSQDATSKTYRFIPMQDFSKKWTDDELYQKYQLSQSEIDFIETMIKPMEPGNER